jgi:hypothetical protein
VSKHKHAQFDIINQNKTEILVKWIIIHGSKLEVQGQVFRSQALLQIG